MKQRRANKNGWKVRQSPGNNRSKKPAFKIPPILLEGDEPSSSVSPADPGQAFTIPPVPAVEVVHPAPALQEDVETPTAPPPEPSARVIDQPVSVEPQASAKGPEKSAGPQVQEPPFVTPETTASPLIQALPEAYGTKRLLLAARDPNWLYAHWDLTRDQLQDYNNRSAHGHLVLRMYQKEQPGVPCNEIHVHPESRNWFVRVLEPGATYSAELGYYPHEGSPWVTLSTSGQVTAPRSGLSDDTSVEYQTLSADLPFNVLVNLAKRVVGQNPALMTRIQQLRSQGFEDVLESGGGSPRRSTREQEAGLTELIQIDESRRISVGSFEINELLQRQMRKALPAKAQLPSFQAWSGSIPSGISSPTSAPAEKTFWFNINAELIIYGATEPNAKVSIAGRPIQLRPDGTFTFRFALPDGHFDLPVQAVAADERDTRRAALQFTRQTAYAGEVEPHPQDPSLKPPSVENVA